jgi:uncharacterized lipoprotein YddW (UPF0748 family)
MTRKFFHFTIPVFLSTVLLACSSSKHISKEEIIKSTPHTEREFRAAWVATVANINWPSKPGLTTKEQEDEAIALLDFLQKNHFNAAILQVRPQCDALYKSDLEPWSYYLTGQQGKAPDPYYDPLEFWVKEAHDRGLELHVWLNPYRAHPKDGKEISNQSVVKKHPNQVVYLKEGYWWLDPAQKETQDLTTAVVMDIVKRYDIDGVHFDDYFYPYPSYNGNADFPDSVSWNAYQQNGGKLSRGDWRRDAVNKLIERLYKEIKAIKPYVKFGLSPFGIWRPGYPESISGFDQYDQLYADARLWLNKGWVDYFSPQLYWPINRMSQSFPVLLGWWSEENKKHRHLWPGISVGRDTSAKNVNEIVSQLMIARGMLPQSKGIVHWSISSLMKNPNMTNAILNGPYANQALVPASPWLNKTIPRAPQVAVAWYNDTLTISWTHPDEKNIFHWVVYSQYNNKWGYQILNHHEHSAEINRFLRGSYASGSINLQRIAVTAVDRTGNESLLKEIEIKK